MLVNTPLLEQANTLRRDAADSVPGRLAVLIETRVGQLVGNSSPTAGLPDDLSPGELLVLDVVEQFLIDVHGITDERFARLTEHYSPDEQVSIMFHLALVDGFAKLDRVDSSQEETS